MGHRVATKSESDKQDEWSKSRVKPNSKQKPPRYDRRREHYTEDDSDLENEKEKKDLSMKSHIAIEEAACRLALQFRGVNLDLADVRAIRSKVDGDVGDPRFWPVLAAATFARVSHRRKTAKYTRVTPSACGTKFVQGEPLPDRQTDTATWPVWNKITPFHPALITSDDHDRIVGVAKTSVDARVLEYNRDAAYRKALDETIWGLDGGKYASKIDAPTYLALLNRLGGLDYNLNHEVYIPTEVDEQKRAETKTKFFDHTQYWGKPADSHIDPGVTKEERWRKLFEDGGVIERDPDEDYLDNFRNPTI